MDVSIAYLMGETDEIERPTLIAAEGNAEVLEAARGGVRVTINKKDFSLPQKQASLEDFARTRETSRNIKSLDDRDLNAAEEMLLASLEAIRKERALRAAELNGDTKSA